MRTPDTDVELAAGLLVAEGIVTRSEQFVAAIHCGGPGSGGAENTYNVLDIALGSDAVVPDPTQARKFYTTSACGICGATSIDAVEKSSAFDVAADTAVVDAATLAELPDRLRDGQRAFDSTGGLHAAALFDLRTGHALVVREDVGRHNAVDKVIGWALTQGRLPLSNTVLQVSGRASFELVQKAVMAGIPILAAVSAPSSLAAELAESVRPHADRLSAGRLDERLQPRRPCRRHATEQQGGAGTTRPGSSTLAEYVEDARDQADKLNAIEVNGRQKVEALSQPVRAARRPRSLLAESTPSAARRCRQRADPNQVAEHRPLRSGEPGRLATKTGAATSSLNCGPARGAAPTSVQAGR